MLTSTCKVNQYHRLEVKGSEAEQGQDNESHTGHGSGPSKDGTATTQGLGVHNVTMGMRDLL